MVFNAGKVQMKFLHLLSNEASQSITLHCLYNAALSSIGTTHREMSRIRFHGWNKQTFEKGTPLEPHVVQDECKVKTVEKFNMSVNAVRLEKKCICVFLMHVINALNITFLSFSVSLL